MKLGQPAGLNSTSSLRRDPNSITLNTKNSGILSSFMGSITSLTRAGSLQAAASETRSEVQQSHMGKQDFASDSSAAASTDMGTVTGTIEFTNIQSKKSTVSGKKNEVAGKVQGSYKLIDFGSAVGIHEDETASGNENENMMTATELEFAGYCQPHLNQTCCFAEAELIFFFLQNSGVRFPGKFL